jgi:putative DNA primase/helicase
MSVDGTIISLEERRKHTAKAGGLVVAGPPSQDAVALEFVRNHGRHHRYVPAWQRWIAWDGKRWSMDRTNAVSALIRTLVRDVVGGTRHERRIATANYIRGVENMARYDREVVSEPGALDADPWLLNTQSDIVDLRDGSHRPHDPAALITRITAAAPADEEGEKLWAQFLTDITQGDADMSAYLQRVAGYCASGATSEDILPYFFGSGSNGKSSFAETLMAALGDYALVFAPEVMMEARGERHPTELAQFMGVRLALCSEPSSAATWNDSRVKSLTGDANISARFMRGDNFSYRRSHKTIVIGNHMPKLNAVTPAIRRRMQMVPFNAVFASLPGQGMRERLREKALGAALAWAIRGTVEWVKFGTSPPIGVRQLTDDYLSDEDGFGQWFEECCTRDATASEGSNALHRNYQAWCTRNGARPESNALLSRYLTASGFSRKKTNGGAHVYRSVLIQKVTLVTPFRFRRNYGLLPINACRGNRNRRHQCHFITVGQL